MSHTDPLEVLDLLDNLRLKVISISDTMNCCCTHLIIRMNSLNQDEVHGIFYTRLYSVVLLWYILFVVVYSDLDIRQEMSLSNTLIFVFPLLPVCLSDEVHAVLRVGHIQKSSRISRSFPCLCIQWDS